jgi:hypothetical protein
MDEQLQQMVQSYGWRITETTGGYLLTNRKGMELLKVTVKGSKYVIRSVNTSDKLLTGNGQLSKGIEKVITQYYYASKV